MNTEEKTNNDLPKKDIKELWWDMALSIGEDPEKFIQDGIKAQEQMKNFDPKQHWINTFGTNPPKDFGNELKEV